MTGPYSHITLSFRRLLLALAACSALLAGALAFSAADASAVTVCSKRGCSEIPSGTPKCSKRGCSSSPCRGKVCYASAKASPAARKKGCLPLSRHWKCQAQLASYEASPSRAKKLPKCTKKRKTNCVVYYPADPGGEQ